MLLKKPLEKNWPITQRFETKVTYMRSGIHSGIDYACPDDTDLLACFDGIVIKTENVLINSGYGRAIWLQKKDNPKIVALYGHTSKILAIKGTEVEAGMIIGKSGHSGYVFSAHGGNGAHLHFALLVDNVWTDPMPFFDTNKTIPKAPAVPISIPVKDGNGNEATAEYETYTVVKGDTLYGIAKKKLGDAEKWRQIYDLNNDKIENPKYIKPGQILIIKVVTPKK